VIGDAGFVVEPTVERIGETLEAVLGGRTPPADPTERARRYDWDNVASEAAAAYERTTNGA
jgi:hypothetical protein